MKKRIPRAVRKVLASVVSAAMVVSFAPTVAFAAVADTDVASIGDTGYSTLSEAFGSVADNAGTTTTITLLKPVSIDSQIEIAANKDVTLDLNGQTITYTANTERAFSNFGKFSITSSVDGGAVKTDNIAAWGIVDNEGSGSTFATENVSYIDAGFNWGAALKNRSGGTMTVKNCKITTNGTPGEGIDNIGDMGIDSSGEVSIEGCEIDSVGNGIGIYGTSTDKDIVIKDTKITTRRYQVPSDKYANIYNGGNGLDLSGVTNGKVIIKSCTFESTCQPSEGYAPGIVVLGCGGTSLDISDTSISSLSGEALLIQNNPGGTFNATLTDCALTAGKYCAINMEGNEDSYGETNIQNVKLLGNTTVSTTASDGCGVRLSRNGKLEVGPKASISAPGAVGVYFSPGYLDDGFPYYIGSAMKASLVLEGKINAGCGICQDTNAIKKFDVLETNIDANKTRINNANTNRGPISISLGDDSVIEATQVGVLLAAVAQESGTDDVAAAEAALATPTLSIDEGAIIHAPDKAAMGVNAVAADSAVAAIKAAKTSVTYVYRNGDDNLTIKAAPGEITLPSAPSRSGYIFTGWSDGDSTYDAGDAYTVGNEATTITANWAEIYIPPTPVHSHNYSWVTTTPATESSEGVMTGTCSCGSTITQAIPKLPSTGSDETATDSSGTKIDVVIDSNETVTLPDGTEATGTVEYKAPEISADQTEVTVPATVTVGDNTYAVTKIAEGAFEGQEQVKSVTIPDTVTTIGASAFAGTSVETVAIPESTTVIGEGAFKDCSSLTEVTISGAVTEIGAETFSGCTALASVDIPASVTTIGASAFAGTSVKEVTIPESTTVIGEGAFKECSSLTEVIISGAVTEIGAETFSGCAALASVDIPASVTTIGASAFEGTLLETVSCQAQTVDASAFSGCTALESIELPAATTVSESAFSGCTALESIELPAATTVSESAFTGCTALNKVELPAATAVGASAFAGCTSLKTVELPKAKTVDEGAFKDASKLKTVELPAVTTVGASAFSGCGALKTVSLPKTKAIGANAFKGASKLKTVTTGTKLTSIGNKALAGTQVKKLVVSSKNLTAKGVAGSLKGSSVTKIVVKVSGSKKTVKKIVAKYAKAFAKKNCGKKVEVVAAK